MEVGIDEWRRMEEDGDDYDNVTYDEDCAGTGGGSGADWEESGVRCGRWWW